MAHENVEKTASDALMLPREESEKVVVVPGQGVGKFLIREDTILTGISGFTGCGRTQFACAGVKKEWSALCWGQQSNKKYYCLLVTLSATFALSLVGTIFFCFTNTVNDAILSNMVIKNNSLAYSMWKRPTVHPLMKVHLFNYTNWQRVRQGLDKKLHVEDVGPYVYSQHIERVNVKFKDDHLTFQERNNFKFMPELSTGVHFDQLYVPNLPLLGVIANTINLPHLGQLTIQSALAFADHHEVFLKLPVQRFLWGYDDTIMDLARPFLSLKGQLNYDKFGLLVSKNGTTSDRITINTGEKHMSKMNLIEKVNGNEMLPHWGSPECNSLSASDGTIFPPSMLDKKTTLYVFYSNLCRRLPFDYIKDIEIRDGIHLMRYSMPEDVFDNPERNPANQCYCDVDSGTCPPRGVINVTACAMGAPVVVSYPHFYRGDPKLREDVTGLSPDPNLHDTYLDIHPTLGIALSGRSSLQLNIQIKKTSVFDSVSFLPEGLILPVAWIQMSVEELPESLQSLVYHGTFSTAAAQLGLALFCSATLLISSVCLLVMILTRRKKPCLTVKLYPELPN